MASRQKQFVDRIYQAARNIGLAEPQARLAAAQAALETGYGRSVKGNNYFGIKAGRSWTGKTQTFKTWEEEGGRRVNIRDKFRAYNSPEESLKDWAALMERRYPDVMQAQSFDEAAKGLRYGKSGGYATDSKYGSKLAYINSNFAPKADGGVDMRMAALPTPQPRPFDPGGILNPEQAGSFSLVSSAQADEAPRGLLGEVNTLRNRMTQQDAYAQPVAKQPEAFNALLSPAQPQQPDLASAYRQYGQSRLAAPVAAPDPVQGYIQDQQATIAANPESMTPEELLMSQPLTPAVAPPAPAPVARQPVQGVLAQPQMAPQPAPMAPPAPPPPPPPSGLDVWNGNASFGIANGGYGLQRLDNGNVLRYSSKYDRTDLLDPSGAYLGQFKGMQEDVPQGGFSLPDFGGGFDVPKPTTRAGSIARNVLGGMAGGMAGSLLGPIGGLLGAAIGREIAAGNGLGGILNRQTQPTYQPNLYPAAPTPPAGQNRSSGMTAQEYNRMTAISPTAANAVRDGKAGLF